eukprot:g7984.t1
MEDEIRRSVLREVFAAISGSLSWTTDVRFEHYPLDVQAIAQLYEDQCTQRLQQKEAELSRRSKLAIEKAVRSLEQRCLVDKQAIRIEAEADKKQLGIEIARVKKRLIEAERERHQANCEKAQTQRDARNIKEERNVLNCRLQETQKELTKKVQELSELEKTRTKLETVGKKQVQQLNERVLNLEAKLNNQQTFWEEKQLAAQKAAAAALEQSKIEIQTKKDEEMRIQLQTELALFENQIGAVSEKQQTTNSILEFVTNELCSVSNQVTSSFQCLFKEHENDFSTMFQSIGLLKRELNASLKDYGMLVKEYAEMKRSISETGYCSLQDLLFQNTSLKKEVEKLKDMNSEQDHQIEELCTMIDALTVKEAEGQELLKEVKIKVEELKSQLQESLQQNERTKQDKEMVDKQLEDQQEVLQTYIHQFQSLHEQLIQEQEAKEKMEMDVESLRSQLDDLERSNGVRMDDLRHQSTSEMKSVIHNLRSRWFGSSSTNNAVLEVLKECLCDATTNSAVRSLKLGGLKSRTDAKTPKRKSNSAMQCMMTRVRNELEMIVMASELESLLTEMKTSFQASHKESLKLTDSSDQTESDQEMNSAGIQQESVLDRQDIQTELLNLECCLFWTILDARWRREDHVDSTVLTQEQRNSSTKLQTNVEKRHPVPLAANRLRTEQRMKDRKLKQSKEMQSSTNSLTCQSLQTDGLQFFKDKEAAEILEIISVLKGYLNKQQSTERELDSPQKSHDQ